MQIVYHLGLHCTDEDRLLRVLLKNRGRLAAEGIVVPAPGRYRPVLREALKALRGAQASREMQETLLDSIMDEDAAARLVLSYDSFLCAPVRAVGQGRLYPMAGEKGRWFPALFPGAETEFALAIRNPATFLPALHVRTGGISLDELLADSDPLALSWAEMVGRLHAGCPDVPLTVWCDEDTPLIWPEVTAAVAGTARPDELTGLDDFLATLLTDEGMERLRAVRAVLPPLGPHHRRRVTAAFLDRFARPGGMDMELDLPGWTEDLVAAMTARYEADVAAIARMEGVRFIAP
jgi:hypothetical protein